MTEKFLEFYYKTAKFFGIICLVNTLIFTLVYFPSYFSEYDVNPASEDLYRPLYEQVEEIKKNGVEKALEMDNASILLKEKAIVLENSECKLKVLLNDKNEVTDVNEIDNFEGNIAEIAIIAGIDAFFKAFLVNYIIFGVFMLISYLVFGIKEIIIKIKKHRKEKLNKTEETNKENNESSSE